MEADLPLVWQKKRISVVPHVFPFVIHVTGTDGTVTLTTLPSTCPLPPTFLIDCLFSLQERNDQVWSFCRYSKSYTACSPPFPPPLCAARPYLRLLPLFLAAAHCRSPPVFPAPSPLPITLPLLSAARHQAHTPDPRCHHHNANRPRTSPHLSCLPPRAHQFWGHGRMHFWMCCSLCLERTTFHRVQKTSRVCTSFKRSDRDPRSHQWCDHQDECREDP